MSNIFFKGWRVGGKAMNWRKGKGNDREKEEKDTWWRQAMKKGHGREEQRLGQRGTEKESKHLVAKAALNIVSSPEGCDIFLQSL